jgi:hypothetical protein
LASIQAINTNIQDLHTDFKNKFATQDTALATLSSNQELNNKSIQDLRIHLEKQQLSINRFSKDLNHLTELTETRLPDHIVTDIVKREVGPSVARLLQDQLGFQVSSTFKDMFHQELEPVASASFHQIVHDTLGFTDPISFKQLLHMEVASLVCSSTSSSRNVTRKTGFGQPEYKNFHASKLEERLSGLTLTGDTLLDLEIFHDYIRSKLESLTLSSNISPNTRIWWLILTSTNVFVDYLHILPSLL